jgi:hypothetical protein
MKRFVFNLVIAGSALYLCACQNSEIPETAFFRDFNLGATVERMNAVQLHPKTGGGGTTTAIGETTERRRNFELEYLLNDRSSEPFDETVFLNELKAEIAKQIRDADIQVNSAATNGDVFHFNYLTKENTGSVEVVGTRVEGNRYNLRSVVRESAGIKSNK